MTTPEKSLYRSYIIEEYHLTKEPYYVPVGDEIQLIAGRRGELGTDPFCATISICFSDRFLECLLSALKVNFFMFFFM